MKIKTFEKDIKEIYKEIVYEKDIQYIQGCTSAMQYVIDLLKGNMITNTGHVRQRHIKAELKEHTEKVHEFYEGVVKTSYIYGYYSFIDSVIETCLSEKYDDIK